MNFIKTKVSLFFALSMTFLFSCGNPHLTVSDISDDNIVEAINLESQISDNSLLLKNTIAVKDNEGNPNLNFDKINLKAVNDKILLITSLSDSALPLRYYFENGESFSFNGSEFPGKNGTCGAILRANETCEIDVKFIESKVGVYEDNLIITNDKDIKLNISLIGQRTMTLQDSNNGKVSLHNPLEMALDYGDIAKGSNSIKIIEINNTSNKEVNIESFDFTDNTFSITSNGSCGIILKPGKCNIEISFNPKEEKNYSGSLFIKEDKEHFLEIKLVGKSHIASMCLVASEQNLVPSQFALPSYDNSTLPYLLKSDKTKSRLTTLYGTAFNSFMPGASLKTVKDAQVITTYKIDSPILNITDFIIDIDGYKVIADSYKDTEMICLSTVNLKKCSGRKFSLKQWLQLSNPNFWKKNSTPTTDRFEKLLRKNEIKCGKEKCQFVQARMSFKEIFKLTNEELEQLGKEKIINIIVADDTRLLSLPKIKVLTEVKKACK